MRKIETVEDAKRLVLQTIAYWSYGEVVDLIERWNHTADNEIYADGRIWVSNPQPGHVLSDDRMIEFARWLDSLEL